MKKSQQNPRKMFYHHHRRSDHSHKAKIAATSFSLKLISFSRKMFCVFFFFLKLFIWIKKTKD